MIPVETEMDFKMFIRTYVTQNEVNIIKPSGKEYTYFQKIKKILVGLQLV